jgi:hypothetical protein
LNAFVTKLDASGSALVYSTYLNGTNWSRGFGIAVDAAGNAYVSGDTGSPDFPTVNPFQATIASGSDAFVTKLNASGSALLYSTYLGGNGNEGFTKIAVDAAGNAYVAGFTESTNFPTQNPFQRSLSGTSDGFVSKLDASGSALAYSTYLGGSSDDVFYVGIAVDTAGSAYVTGVTNSVDFPLADPLQRRSGGLSDGFVAKFNASGSGLVYSTYLGGRDNDAGAGIAVDTAGNAYVTGFTLSRDFPTVNAAQRLCRCAISYDAFVTKISP